MRLTTVRQSWGFGFLYLRNVKCFVCNHKRVYPYFGHSSIGLRIKPRKRLVRAAAEPRAALTVENDT